MDVKHHSSGYKNCIDCANLLVSQEPNLNVYWCKKCKKSSVATMPTKYANCPCGEALEDIKNKLGK